MFGPSFWYVKIHSEQSTKGRSFHKVKMDHVRKIRHLSQGRVLPTNALIPLMLLSEEMFILLQTVDEESFKLIVHNFTQIFTFPWRIFYQHFCIHCTEGRHFLSVKVLIHHCSCFYWQFQVVFIIHDILCLYITDMLFFYSCKLVIQFYINWVC